MGRDEPELRPAADDTEDRDQEQVERQPLLSQPAQSASAASPDDVSAAAAHRQVPAGAKEQPAATSRRSTEFAAASIPAGAKEVPSASLAAGNPPALVSEGSGGTPAGCGVCRICLEDEDLGKLEAPCACTGTQRYAHHGCIQKWVNEKHTLRCEICDTDYKGDYTVPQLLPPDLDGLPFVTPIGSLYMTIAADGDAPGVGRSVLLTDPWAEDDEDEAPPAMSWCASLLVFLLFMLVLHHSVVLNVPPGDGEGGPGLPTGPGGAPTPSSPFLPGGFSPTDAGSAFPGPGGVPSGPSPGMPSPGTALAAGLSLFLLWVLTKVLLVAVPLATLMRLTAHHQGEAAEADPELGDRGRAPHSNLAAASSSSAAASRQQLRLQQELVLLTRLRRYLQMAEAANTGTENRGSSGRPRLPGVV